MSSNKPPTQVQAPEEPRRNARLLLSAYYQSAAASASSASASASASSATNRHGIALLIPEHDTTNIDSQHFVVEDSFNSLIKNTPLPALVEKDKELVSEIKRMDSDMKTLVYENYNKFISASETIHKMKTNVETMEEEMKGLSRSMETISASSEAINSSLAAHREKLEHLSTVHRLLQRLQFVVELPGRLRTCLQMKSYTQAVGYYCKTEKTLEKYSNLPAFQAIKSECAGIMKDVKNTLWPRLKEPMSQVAAVSPSVGITPFPHSIVEEAAQLLLQLGEDKKVIKETFIIGHKTALAALTKYFSTTNTKTDQKNLMQNLENSFFTHISLLHESFCNVFIPTAQRKVGDPLFNELVALVKSEFNTFSEHRITQLKTSISKGMDPDSIVSALQFSQENASTYNGVYPFLKLSEQAEDMISGILTHLTTSQFQSLENEAKEKLCNLDIKADRPGRVAATTLTNGVAESIIKNLSPLSRGASQFLQNHVTMLRASIHSKTLSYAIFLDDALNDYCLIGDKPNNFMEKAPNKAQYALALFDLAQGLETLVPTMFATISESFPSSQDAQSRKEDVLKLSQRTTSKLLQQYVLLEGGSLSEKIWENVFKYNWQTEEPPSRPTHIPNQITTTLQLADSMAAATLPDTPFQRERGNPSASSLRMGSSLFDRKHEYFGRVDPDKGSVIRALVRVVVKAMVECLREMTIGLYGFQQLQVDLQVLSGFFTKILGDRSEAEAHIVEILSTARQRCLEPLPLDQAALIRLSLSSN